ncbi:hypothetical protein K439DRAFT_1662323 [Ramaria rubella]|nr:hypothetical protein K439DRAFT_1662323 [Ramaria rubella]
MPGTVEQIKSDLATIGANLDTLIRAVNAIPASGAALTHFSSLVTIALNLGYSLNQGALDAASTPGPVDPVNAASILATVQILQASAVAGLGNFARKKKALQAVLPGSVGAGVVVQLISSTLLALNTEFDALASALITIAPPPMQGTGNTIKATVDGVFTNTIRTFSAV